MGPDHGTGSGRYTYQIKVNFRDKTTQTSVTGFYTNVGGLSGNINFINTSSYVGKTGPISDSGSHGLSNPAGSPAAITGGAFGSDARGSRA